MGTGTGYRAGKTLPQIIAFLIVLMVCSSYSNTFTSPPYLDDFHSFIYEKALYLDSLTPSSILSLAHTKFGLTRFLPMITFAINHTVGKSNVLYFHVVNILIHLFAFFALFWFLRQILAAAKSEGPEKPLYEIAEFFPLCAAAMWALSPVQTSAVTYLVQRMASMQALFFTLSSACFIKARLLSEKEPGRGLFFYFFCAVAAACSFLSKENSAALPVALVMIDVWFFDSAWLKKARAWCRKIGWEARYTTVALLVLVFVYGLSMLVPQLLSGYANRNFTLAERLLTEGRVVVWYMSLLLWPVPSRLSMEHSFQISTSLFAPHTTLPALALIGAMIFLAVRFRKRFPVITFGIAWFFLNLVIESTVIPLELVFEHRLYLPSMGFYVSTAAVFVIVLRRISIRLSSVEFTKAACSLFLISASCLALLTFTRNGDWENKATIHYDVVKKAPDSPRTNADYANTLCELGQYEEAIKYAERAIELGQKGNESDALAFNAITIALIKQRKTDEAIERVEKFIEDKLREVNADSVPNICLNLAQACVSDGKPKDALRWTLEALKYIQFTDKSAYKKGLVEMMLLGIVSKFGTEGGDLADDGAASGLPPAILVAMEFERHGEGQYAREIIEKQYAKDPGDLYLSAKIEKLQKEDAQNSVQKGKWNSFQRYLKNPFSSFNFDMAVAYLVQEKQLPKFFQEIGERRLDAALEISPGSPEARLLKGWYFFNRNDVDHATVMVRSVLDGDPANSNAWLALGFFLARAGDNDGAIAAFEKVIALFPGYSNRSVVEQICTQLREEKPIESASNRQ